MQIDLPKGVPAPKFKHFQQVRCCCAKRSGASDSVYTVTGVTYSDFHTALLEETCYVGWRYEVSRVYGKTQEEILEAFGADPTFFMYENNLVAVEEV